MAWTILYSRRALKDTRKLRAANLDSNVRELLNVLRRDPYNPTKSYLEILRATIHAE